MCREGSPAVSCYKEVIQIVFRYLDMYSLFNCYTVCKFWKKSIDDCEAMCTELKN